MHPCPWWQRRRRPGAGGRKIETMKCDPANVPVWPTISNPSLREPFRVAIDEHALPSRANRREKNGRGKQSLHPLSDRLVGKEISRLRKASPNDARRSEPPKSSPALALNRRGRYGRG